MGHFTYIAERGRALVGLTLAALIVLAVLAARFNRPVTAQQGAGISPEIAMIPAGQAYRQTNLVSDIPGLSPLQDPLLVNPWGVAMLATSPFWVANNGTSSVQLLKGDVSGSPLVL